MKLGRHLQVVPALVPKSAGVPGTQAPAAPTLANYQRMNLRNALMALKASTCDAFLHSAPWAAISCSADNGWDVRCEVSTDAHCAALSSQAAISGNDFWAAFCNGFEEGIDCLTGEEGQLEDLLAEPLHLGNVLDYGADPNGKSRNALAESMYGA